MEDNKTYSPEIKSFSLDDKGAINLVAALFVSPIRFVVRVMHNICVLPANLLKDYANGLQLVGFVMLAIGVIDFVLYRRWPLLVSQIPVIMLASSLKKKASKAVSIAAKKDSVDIDYSKVEEILNTVYDRVDNAIGKDDNNG